MYIGNVGNIQQITSASQAEWGVCTSGMWATYSVTVVEFSILRVYVHRECGQHTAQTDDSIIKWKVDSSD